MKKDTEHLTANELQALLDKPGTLLLDVLPEEYFAVEHLPKAQNACVYNVDFLDRVKQFAPDVNQRIVVYGSSSRNLASSVAASKLLNAGWNKVADFRGGLEEWTTASLSTEGTHVRQEVNAPKDGTYYLDTEKSVIEWTGRNLGGKHTGTLKLSAGEINIRDSKAVGGHFTINMQSIANTDIQDRSMASVLVQHLISDDFFETAKYPDGRFVISAIEPPAEQSVGRPNYKVFGSLTLKGVVRQIEFPALIGMQSNGSMVAQANFDIDRTEWNILYGSGKFFENLGMHLVNDLVSLQLKIVTTGR